MIKNKLSKKDYNKIKLFSNNLAQHSCKIISIANTSHIGSVLSIRDILSVLFLKFLKYDKKKSKFNNSFILSKGHAGAGVYTSLFLKGLISQKELYGYCSNGSKLFGHITKNNRFGIEFSTGSLGHGLPFATGLALSDKLKRKNNKIYVLMSDGEWGEGSNWEALLFASHHKLNNLCIIIDYNNLQSLTTVDETLGLQPFKNKFESFGFKCIEIDGHSLNDLYASLSIKITKKPIVIICNTIKGKGVSFMENKVLWHYRSPNEKELLLALKELKNER